MFNKLIYRTMKRFLALMLAALTFGAVSCQRDAAPQGPVGKTGDGLRFEFRPPANPFVTRAAGQIATDDEWNIHSLDVYVAIDGTVTKLTEGTEYTFDASQLDSYAYRTYTIVMDGEWVDAHAADDVYFYFVGNADSSVKGAPDLTATAETDFVESLTTPLAVTDGAMELIPPVERSTPHYLLFSEKIGPVKVDEDGTIDGDLVRRVARFDVQNTEAALTGAQADNAFRVTRILVADAADRGLVFGAGNPAAATAIQYANHVEIGALENDVDYTLNADLSTLTPHTLAPAVFYLYPTHIGAGKTQIYVIGKHGGDGAEVILPVTGEADILANNRYVLSVDATQLKVRLLKVDYDEGEILPAISGPLANTVAPTASHGLVGDGVFTGTADFDGTEATLTIPAGESSTLRLYITSQYGTTYELTGDGIPFITFGPHYNDDPSTRAAYSVYTEYTVYISATDEPGGEIDATLTIDGWNDPNLGKKIIHIRRPVEDASR